MAIFRCKICNIEISVNLIELHDDKLLDEHDQADLIPRGKYFISKGEYEPEKPGDYLANLKDMKNLKRHSDLKRLNGCCGLDGMDGLNLICTNGHEIAIERSDCWTPHYAIMSSSHVIITT